MKESLAASDVDFRLHLMCLGRPHGQRFMRPADAVHSDERKIRSYWYEDRSKK